MARDYKQLWKGVTDAPDEVEAVRALSEIVTDSPGRAFVLGLEREEAELCIETLDYGIAEHNLKPAENQAFFLMLRRLAERHDLLPDRIVITEGVEVSDEIVGFGGFSDARRGVYNGSPVVVKALRVTPWTDLKRMRKRFYRKVIVWERLSHPNVLKLVGIQEDKEKREFVTISEWMERGTIMDHIENHHVNRLELLHGAAQGLEYLHDARVTHGDLKGASIFVSNDTPPRACIADSLFMTMIPDPAHPTSCSARMEGGTIMFMAPELLVPEAFGKTDAVPTPQADIYAFGMVNFQVLTGEVPFRSVGPSVVGYRVSRGDRPEKPENASDIGFSDLLWDLTQRCWDGNAESRPAAGEVVTRLGEVAANWGRLMPPCTQADSDVASDSGSGSVDFDDLFELESSPDP